MVHLLRWLAVVAGLVGVGCGGVSAVPAPLGVETEAPQRVLVWVGQGEAERQEDGVWVRDPRFDYAFSVEQRRYHGRWRSYKTMRRTHPDYDGSAGPREQVLWFDIVWSAPDTAGALAGAVTSSLGPGDVTSDAGFSRSTLALRPDISSHAPFDTYRIDQRYLYDEGRLEESVSLVKTTDGAERVWVRNTERATLFVPARGLFP